ncbi:ArsR/SmtB family transcription factor [Streptomyces sp. NPDC054847]
MVLESRPEGGTLEIGFSAEDVARIRFAVSPLWEVVASVRVLRDTGPGAHRPWAERVRPALAAAKLDLAPLSSLIGPPPAGVPGFLVAPPMTPQPSLDVELAALRSMPHELLRTTTPAAREGVAALRADPDRGLGRLADVIAAYWEVAMAPYWPRILTVVEGDILYRAKRLAEGGARRLFDDLDPRVTWDSGTLQVMHRCVRGERRLDGRGLVLVPSVFGGPRIFSDVDSPDWQPTLRYPPRGTATLWEARAEPLSDALAGVLGRSRALLLAELAAPASTTDLARRTGLSAGGVSQHLTAMRAAGLVSAHRTGRVVLYARTSVGEALVTG